MTSPVGLESIMTPEIAAVIVSCLAVFVALGANRKAKRAADASEKSANEAKRSNDMSAANNRDAMVRQVLTLSDDIDRMCDAAFRVWGDLQPRLNSGVLYPNLDMNTTRRELHEEYPQVQFVKDGNLASRYGDRPYVESLTAAELSDAAVVQQRNFGHISYMLQHWETTLRRMT